MAESGYIRPVTAQQLFELHPDVASVFHYAEGAVYARQRVVGRTALLGIYLLSSESQRKAGRPTLAVVGGYGLEAWSAQTSLAIPVEPNGYDRAVVNHTGDATPAELIGAARKATELLDGYLGLTPDQLDAWRNMPGESEDRTVIHDDMADYSGYVNVMSRWAAAREEGLRDSYDAARQIFLSA